MTFLIEIEKKETENSNLIPIGEKNQSPFNKKDVCLSFGKFRSEVGWNGSVVRLGDHATVVVGSFRPILANTMANDARLSPYNISRNRRQLTLGQ